MSHDVSSPKVDSAISKQPVCTDTVPAPPPVFDSEAKGVESKQSQDKSNEERPINLQLIVRGGTTSSAYDMEQAKRVADADARRKQLDADMKLGNTPIEQGGGMMFSHHFADPLATPKVHIRYVNSKKETIMDMLCELVYDEISDNKLLQFVCPKCVQRGVHPGEAQCTVRDANRKWHLDARGAGGISRAETVDLQGRPKLERYLNAGVIMDTDLLVCPNYNCGAKYKIHKNMMYDWRK